MTLLKLKIRIVLLLALLMQMLTVSATVNESMLHDVAQVPNYDDCGFKPIGLEGTEIEHSLTLYKGTHAKTYPQIRLNKRDIDSCELSAHVSITGDSIARLHLMGISAHVTQSETNTVMSDYYVTFDSSDALDLSENGQIQNVEMEIAFAAIDSQTPLTSDSRLTWSFADMCSPFACHAECTDCRIGTVMDKAAC